MMGCLQPRKGLVGDGEAEDVEVVFEVEAEGNVLGAEIEVGDGAAVRRFADNAGYAAVTERPPGSRGKRLAAQGELNRQTASVLVVRLLAFHRSGRRNHRQS